MKIAIVSHLKYPIAEPFLGGLEMHTHMLARQLIARGHAVTLFASEGSDAALGLHAVCAPTGTPETPCAEAKVAIAERQAYHSILAELTHGDFDLVHNNSLHSVPLTHSHRLRMPMVTTLHTPPFDELASGVARRGRDDIHFVAVSGAVARMWHDIVAVDETICNGIELDHFVPQLDQPASRHAIWSGRIVPEKGLHLAIPAARQAGIPLRIAGPRTDSGYWRDAVAPLLGEGATYIGHFDHATLAAEVAGAAVAVITPCFEEPFGLVVAEALACGTPVAGFARGALPDIVDAATGRLAQAGDVAGLAWAIRAATQLSRAACRARAEMHCDARLMVDRYEALYLQLLAAPRLEEAA